MNKEEFEREVLRIADVIHQNYPPKLKGDTEIMEFANAIRDLLEKDAAENEGWQLVPKEPTQEQYKAGWDCYADEPTSMREMYQAMLAAAPEYKEE